MGIWYRILESFANSARDLKSPRNRPVFCVEGDKRLCIDLAHVVAEFWHYQLHQIDCHADGHASEGIPVIQRFDST